MPADTKAPTSSSSPPAMPTEQQRTPTPSLISFSSGHALTLLDANVVANAEKTEVVLLAGPIRSGKTTFAVSIFEAFRHGPFAGTYFAGSRTLLGFEERCHLSRAASGGDAEDTERTKHGIEEILLHLRVQRRDGEKQITSLLICDRSGEIFEAANDSNESLLQIPLFARADRLVLFLDGERLLQPGGRQRVRQDCLTLLRAGSETGRLSGRSVDVVFSKQDLVKASPEVSTTLQFQDQIEADCTARFGTALGALYFHRVAVRPSPDEGAINLFLGWLGHRARTLERQRPSRNYDHSVREIDRFGRFESAGAA